MMKFQPINYMCLLVGLFIFFVLSQPCLAGEIKAFSLREADRLLGRGLVDDDELRRMGEITRFAGMVFDRDTRRILCCNG